ncbi:MAG: GrpB family protein [Bacteroidota bacterium]
MEARDVAGMRVDDGVTVVPYRPAWVREFERVRDELRTALPAWVIGIEHVGSTSVPGLLAKPIVDILVGVPDLARGLSLRAPMERLGFTYRPDDDIPDRHYFPRTVGGLRRHHVSVSVPGTRHHRNTLLFRDALRQDPARAQRYGALKQRLASAAGRDRLDYLNGKTDFVLEVLRAAGGEVDGRDYPVRNLGRGLQNR